MGDKEILTPENVGRMAMEAKRSVELGGKRCIFVLVWIAVVLSGARTDITAGPRYKTIDLGTLGGSDSWASGINNLGQVVGTSRTASGDYRAFLWEDTNGNGECDPGEMQDLGTLSGSGSVATGINNIGQVVGSSTTASGRYHAFLWDSNSGMIDLGTLNGNRFSYGTGINDSGQVVGYSADSTEPDIDNVAFLWDSVNGMIEFLPSSPFPSPFPSPYTVTSKATGINNSGQVVGTLRTYENWGGELITVTSAFLWDSNDGRMLLGSLGGEWDDGSSANAINNIGQVAGGSDTNEFFIYHAFLWDQNGGMIDLGTLAGMQSSVGYGINDKGCVVGRCHNNMYPGPEEAFMWDSVNGMIALSYQLPGYSDWQKLRRAYGVNSLGQIVGSGLTTSQQEHAFIMTPLAEPNTTHLVPAEYPTIQAAINAAWDGDTIIVALGTYSGSGNRDIDFKGKAITVRSTEPNDAAVVAATVIDCNGSYGEPHRGFKFDSGEGADSVLAGVTVKNGYGPEEELGLEGSSSSADVGGGIFCYGSSPTISKCVIRNNMAEYGGGLWCTDSNAKIFDCVIEENKVYHGAGGACFFSSDLTIEDCTVRDNEGGSGIACWLESSPNITNCTISDNNSAGIWCDIDGEPNINGCVISGNKAGGVVDCRGIIRNCIISGNSAEDGAGLRECYCPVTDCLITDNVAEDYGGGICRCTGPIINCIISNNRAGHYGGGVDSCWGAITNCIISDNRAEGNGGGLAACRGPITNCTITDNIAESGYGVWGFGAGMSGCDETTNCIVWGNWPDQIYGSGSVSYSDVEGGWEGEGNIDAEPGFAFEGDYHLMPGSACIDAGTDDPCGGLVESDLDGVSRLLDGDGDGNAVADMGAYEFSLEHSTIAVSSRMFWFVQDWPEREAQTLSIRNCGGAPLNWQVVEDCEWLEVTPANGESLDEIDEVTITVDSNGLAPGLYSYTLTVEDPNASNSPVGIVVEMPVGELLWVRSGEYPTIQSAVDAANNYDVVVVQDGTYKGEGNRDLDFGGKVITVKSENDPNNCVIDCEDSGDGFYFHNGEGEDSIVDGLTITGGGTGVSSLYSSPTIKNCNIMDNSKDGVCCREGGLTVRNCRVTSNGEDGIVCATRSNVGLFAVEIENCVVSDNLGTGIGCGNATIENCTITNNSGGSDYGGGISCGGKTSVIECIVSGNLTGSYGGGIYCSGETTISKCIVSGNWSGGAGGGICCELGRPKVENCSIIDNIAVWEGGGIHCERDANLAVLSCSISGNTAERSGGGGVSCSHDCQLRLGNCIVSGNSANSRGGGVQLLGGDLAVSNCSVAGNRVRDMGGGLYCSGSATLSSCILWGNEGPQGRQLYLRRYTDVLMRYSDIEGGQGDVYVESGGNLDWGEGNIDTEPEFIEAGYWDVNGTPNDVNDDFWVDGDYHLLAGSPCIDAGDPNYAAGPNETDLDGKPRVIGGRVDMGAYEFNHLPVACIVGGDGVVEADGNCEGRVVLDGSCSSDADSTAGTNDDINDFDWYEVIDVCEPNSDIYLGSGEVIECNLGLGEHLIILEVTDRACAFDTNEVTITVVDDTPPEFGLVVEPNELWPPNGKMVEVRPEWEASDNCDEEVEVSLADISMNVEGDVNNYVEMGDDGSIYLRARKSKGGSSRIYTLTYEAVDDSGNVAEASATVTVPHSRGPRKLGSGLVRRPGRQIYRRKVQRRGAKE